METDVIRFDHQPTPAEMDEMEGREIISQRSPSGKVFSLGRGLMQTVVYADIVHYKDAVTGNWIEIDNTLEKQENAAGEVITNSKNCNTRVNFYGSSAENMITLCNDRDQMIGWRFADVSEVDPVIEDHQFPAHKKNDKRRDVLDHLEGTACYDGIFGGANLRCTIRGGSFKDEIVWSSKPQKAVIEMSLTAPKMHLKREESGCIVCYAEDGSIPYSFPAPWLEDTEGNIGSVNVVVEEAGSSCWLIRYEMDDEWLATAAYPVRMDPAVRTQNLSSGIEDNFTTSKSPDAVQPYGNTNLRLSKNSSTYGESYAWLQFTDSSLPQISSSYYITKAYLYMALKSQPSSAVSVYTREVTTSWSSTTITYNSEINFSNLQMDYVYYATSATLNAYSAYDISNLVRKWYAAPGDNHGVRFEAGTTSYMSLHSSDSAYYKPYVIINYVSLAGLESYLTYENQSCGRAGTGYVSLYNGNLIFAHQDTSTNGHLMPVSLTHYYNSCYYKKNAFGTGYGWNFSGNQYLHRETLGSTTSTTSTTTYYVYTDSDGTRHFFQKVSGKWKDLSGLGLELTLDTTASSATITDKSDNTMVFDLPTVDFEDDDESTSITGFSNIKPLKSTSDACGNTASYSTDTNRRLTQITDGAGRPTAFTQNTNGTVASVTAPGNPPVTFTYDSDGYLSSITHEDGLSVSYTYNENGLLHTATNVDGLTLTYDYTENRTPYRVAQVTVSNGSTMINGRKYAYGDCMTVVTDLVANADHTELMEGKSMVWHFNDYGNVVSVNDGLGYGCFAQYSDDLPVNHPEVASRMQKAVVNLLKGHHMEASGSWTNASISGTGTYSYATDAKYMGSKSLKMTKTNTTGFMTSYQTVTLEKGRTYTFSAYYKTLNAASAQLRVTYQNAEGESMTEDSLTQQDTTGWDRISLTFTLPEDAADDTAIVRLMAANGTGSVWFDCTQLEEGAVPGPYNMLLNGDFTFNVDGKPQSWSENSSNTASDMVYSSCTGTKPEGLSTHTMRLYGTGRTKYAGIYQDITVSGSKDDVFAAGGWSFNYSKPRNGQDYRYNIRVSFLKSGTSSTRVNTDSIEWSEEWTDWQFAAGPVVAPCNYTAIRFNIDYERNINYAEFNGLFLYKEEFGHSYAYDENGNVLSVQDLAGSQSHATYDDHNNLLTWRQPGRSADDHYTLSWGSTTDEQKRHLLKYTESPMGIVNKTQYDLDDSAATDPKGLPIASVLQDAVSDSGRTMFIRSETTYTNDRNYVSQETDASGNTVTTVTDADLGTVETVTDPMNHTVAYTYDAMKRTTLVSAQNGAGTGLTAYSYQHDRLKEIAHNTTGNSIPEAGTSGDTSVRYHFGYDEAGRATTVKVGLTEETAQTLSENIYNPDGMLAEVVYGNGTTGHSNSVQYQYDAYKRIAKISFNGEDTPRYTYDYGPNGQIARVTDTLLGRTVASEYDTANRPMRITHRENGAHLYTGEVAYDDYNNLATFKEQVDTDRTAYTTSFTYDTENKPTDIQYGDSSHKMHYTYDGIGRLTGRVVTNGSGNTYSSTYGYKAGSFGTGSTTNLIESIQQPGAQFSYTYDAKGNITSVTQNSVTVTYAYDALGQLIRVNDPNDPTANTEEVSDGTTWLYAYDNGGNILSKTWYPYTTAEAPTGGTVITYTYGNADWKDQLTAYNSAAITYDSIGNPINDCTWTYTWQDGRQLAQMSSASDTIQFRYNADGLRVQKISEVTGTTDYILHGKNIVHITNGSNSMHFWYDAQNRPALVEYNGATYAYVYDLQGDVVGLVDSNNSMVVSYVYDAWGRPLSVNGSMSTTLGVVQPFRYRGYVWDEETGLYYLRSRYYKPEQCRFISADCIITSNMFGYCNNRPISMADHSGKWGTNQNKMPFSFLLECLYNMLQDNQNGKQWKYAPGQRKRKLDCIGMICYCAQQYFTEQAFFKVYNVKKGANKAANSNATEFKSLSELSPDQIPRGAILYYENNSHVGVYIGHFIAPDGTEYEHGVIHSEVSFGVHVTQLEDRKFTKYCDFNYIEYDLSRDSALCYTPYIVLSDE